MFIKSSVIRSIIKKQIFGRYPQTKVVDTLTIDNIKKEYKTNELGYIEYNGNEYKEYNGSYYLVEPIKWKILGKNNNSYKLVSDLILDQGTFYADYRFYRDLNNEIIYHNNYEYSNIRTWLNGYNGSSYNVEDYTGKGFIDIAFTEKERKLINETLVDNSIYNSLTKKFVCNDTLDKIYLLSYEEVMEKYFKTNDERKTKITDYAIARKAYGEEGYGCFLLRTPSDRYPSFVLCVDYEGTVDICAFKSLDIGVRPMLEIKVK